MNAWIEKLTRREQLAATIGVLALVGFSLYLFFWQPVVTEQNKLRALLSEQSAAFAWMQQAAEEVRQLRGRHLSTPKEREDESLFTLVDRTARATMNDGLKRMEPEGQRTVKVWLEEAHFDNLMRWLQELQTNWGVQVTVVNLQRTDRSGFVTGRLVMDETAQ